MLTYGRSVFSTSYVWQPWARVTLAQLLVLPKHQFLRYKFGSPAVAGGCSWEGAPGDSCTQDRRWKMGILNCGSASDSLSIQ